ncbi:MAG: hypothetical protein IJZ80_04835 [Clostridia bacterium]|nr:hypothetical protein [Clostridia bacterium]
MLKRIPILCICLCLILGSFGGSAIVAEETVQVTPMISIGSNFMVALRYDGTAFAWGKNQNGELGNGTNTDSSLPVAVTMPVVDEKTVHFSSVCAGYDHVIALATDGTVWTWGSDANGQLGNRNLEATPQPTQTPKQVLGALEGKKVVSVAAGISFSLALTSEGKVYAWGTNQFGILGNLEQYYDTDQGIKVESVAVYPTRITALDQPFITAIFAGPQTAAALDATGQVWLWGENEYRETGTDDVGEDGEKNVVSVPVKKTSSEAYCAVSVALGGDHTAVLMNDGKVASFGYQKYGQLGNGETKNEGTQVFKYLAPETAAVKAISAGASHSAAIGTDGAVYIWGKNASGILGTGSDADVLSTPTKVVSDLWETPVFIAAGYDNTAVIDGQGLVYTWGKNTYGELGNGATAEFSDAPVSVRSVDGNAKLMLGSGSSDAVYQTQITLNATIPAPTFAISIPASIDVGELTQKSAGDSDAVKSTVFEVKATNVSNLFGEKKIVVEIASSDGVFRLTDEEFSLAYAVYNAETGGTNLESGDGFATFLSDGIAKGRIEIDQSQITRQGSYSGRMIFTVKVTEREGAQE